jgi:uncharacterized delta-60 repeat protein
MLKQLWRSALIAALLAIICTSFPIAQAAPGDLDKTFAGFGSAGKATLTGLNMPGSFYNGGMALAPDGKIVMVGFNDTHLLVWRYLPNGQPDPSFGAGGLYAYTPAGFDTIPSDVAVQPDGKIVIVGRNRYDYLSQASDFLVLRVLADGSNLDFSLAGNGFVFTDFVGKYDSANAVLIQPDGKIVVCGSATVGNSGDFAVARYHPNGAPDNSFDNDGKTTMDFGAYDKVEAIARQNDGKLVLAGDSGGDFALLRLTGAGIPDNSFDGDGKVITDLDPNAGEVAYAVAVQPNDGKIIALGSSFPGNTTRGAIDRYEANGALDDNSDGDGGFASGGELLLDPGVGRLHDLALQPDGKILGLGQHSDGSGNFFFYRADAYGVDDPTFGINGLFGVGFGANEWGTDLALLPDGRILGFGVKRNAGSGPFTCARTGNPSRCRLS